MDVVIWILSGVLALVFLGAGLGKLTQPKAKLEANPNMAWAGDFSEGTVKLIGALEVLGAIGLVLPWALDVAPVLTPLAALGLAALMVAAAATHVRRGEHKVLPVNVVLGVLALVVAIARFSG